MVVEINNAQVNNNDIKKQQFCIATCIAKSISYMAWHRITGGHLRQRYDTESREMIIDLILKRRNVRDKLWEL